MTCIDVHKSAITKILSQLIRRRNDCSKGGTMAVWP